MTQLEAETHLTNFLAGDPFQGVQIVTWDSMRGGVWKYLKELGHPDMSNVTLGKTLKKLGWTRNMHGKDIFTAINVVYSPTATKEEKIRYWEELQANPINPFVKELIDQQLVTLKG